MCCQCVPKALLWFTLNNIYKLQYLYIVLAGICMFHVHRLKKEGIVIKAPCPAWFLVDTKS